MKPHECTNFLLLCCVDLLSNSQIYFALHVFSMAPVDRLSFPSKRLEIPPLHFPCWKEFLFIYSWAVYISLYIYIPSVCTQASITWPLYVNEVLWTIAVYKLIINIITHAYVPITDDNHTQKLFRSTESFFDLKKNSCCNYYCMIYSKHYNS
jgi:hypothetical protein